MVGVRQEDTQRCDTIRTTNNNYYWWEWKGWYLPQKTIQWYNPHPYATNGAMEAHTYGPRRVLRSTQWTTTTGFAQHPAVQHHIAPVRRDVISTVISGLSVITQRPKIDVRNVDINVGNDEVDVGRRRKGRN